MAYRNPECHRILSFDRGFHYTVYFEFFSRSFHGAKIYDFSHHDCPAGLQSWHAVSFGHSRRGQEVSGGHSMGMGTQCVYDSRGFDIMRIVRNHSGLPNELSDCAWCLLHRFSLFLQDAQTGRILD